MINKSGLPVFTRSRCRSKGLKGLPHSLKAPQYKEVGCPLVSQIWFNSQRTPRPHLEQCELIKSTIYDLSCKPRAASSLIAEAQPIVHVKNKF